MRIDLGPIAFNVDDSDASGTYWYVTNMTGWEAPAYRQQTLAPDERDYEVITEALLAGRTVTLEGVVKAPSEAAFWNAWNYLSGILPPYPLLNLTVHEVPAKSMLVARSQQSPQFTMIGGSSFEFMLPMYAPKPLKVGGISPPRVIGGA